MGLFFPPAKIFLGRSHPTSEAGPDADLEG